MGLLEDPNLTKATFFVLPWKGYHTQEELEQFIKQVSAHPKSASQLYLLAIPYSLLEKQAALLAHPAIIWGCDAMSNAMPGSFTESIAAKVLQKKNVRFVLIGTAEGRSLRQETNAHINSKIKKALENEITPFFCMGESLQELQEERGNSVLKKQCEEGLAGLTLKQIARIAFVYEAPWVQKTSEIVSLERLSAHYFVFRKIVAEVVGPKVFPQLKFIDPFPNDLENFGELLHSFGGKGLFVSEPSLIFPLLDALDSLEEFTYPAQAMEPFSEAGLEEAPRISEKSITEGTLPEEPILARMAAELPWQETDAANRPASVKASEAEKTVQTLPGALSLPTDMQVEGILMPEGLAEEIVANVPRQAEEKALEELQILAQETDEKGSAEVPEQQEDFAVEEFALEKPLQEDLSEEVLADRLEELMPAAESEPFTPLFDESIGQLEEFSEEDLLMARTSPEAEAASELEERVKSLNELNQALAACYHEISKKVELLPKLRTSFPEKLSKMNADLNQLDPLLQEEINRGNVAFFTENPEKAQEASGVLLQLQELNFLLQETTAIPRDIDRLISNSRQIRKQLEEAWAYFTKNRMEIKSKSPDFEFPTTPSQLAVKEPPIDLAPKEIGPSPLVGKKVAVVRTPPLKK